MSFIRISTKIHGTIGKGKGWTIVEEYSIPHFISKFKDVAPSKEGYYRGKLLHRPFWILTSAVEKLLNNGMTLAEAERAYPLIHQHTHKLFKVTYDSGLQKA